MGRRVLHGLVVAGWLIGQSSPAVGQSASDVLISGDIGGFKCIGARATGGKTGIVGGAGHFPPGSGTMYTISCDNEALDLGVDVEVTLHSSSQWLGHEVEGGYRDPDDSDGRLGLLSGAGVKVREIDGSRIYYWGLGGGSYTWISGTKTVVEVKYTDLQRTKPEPLEIVRAYLAKYPSSLPAVDIRSTSYTENWIRNEMERRVWLMEKWVGVGNADVLKQAEATRQIFYEHFLTFAQYAKKYLGDDQGARAQAFLAAEKDWPKLVEEVGKLRVWWDANKTRSLLLSGSLPGLRFAEGWPILLGGLGAARQLWVERGRVSGYLGRWLLKERGMGESVNR